MSINMIRTTISRIKRVWAITFSPGLLRGDLRCTPGKFQILTSNAQNSALLRSKSSDSVYEDRHRKPKHGSSTGGEERDVFDDYLSPDMLANDTMHGAPPLYQKTSACRCDECNKIIAEIFGEESMLSQKDRNIKRKVLANFAQVNMSDNIDTDQFSTDKVQGLYHKKKSNDDDSLPKLKVNKAASMDDTGDKKSELIDTDTHQMYTNLYDVDPEEYQCASYDANKSIPFSQKKGKDQNVDAYWKDVYETAVGENSVYCEPTLTIDEDTLNMYNVLKYNESKFDDPSSGARRLKHSPREVEKMLYEKPFESDNDLPPEDDKTIKASTEKQEDEKLIQKVEHIEEAPLVEAEKPKIEGFQITPRVLGYVEKADDLKSLDEVAKRCLSSPHSQIDEILLKEMEKLGIPLTVQRSSCGLKLGDQKTDTSIKPKKTVELEIELNKPELKSTPPSSVLLTTVEKSNNAEGFKDTETSQSKAIRQYYFDLKRTKASDDSESKEKPNLEDASETNVGDLDRGNKSGWSYWRTDNTQRQDPRRSGTSEQEQEYTNFTNRLWQKNQLDPKHVLTCNETCAISPKPIVYNDMKNVEGTKVFFDQQNIQKEECMRENPILEDGESDPITRTVNIAKENEATADNMSTTDKLQCTIKTDNLKPSETVDCTDDTKSMTAASDGMENQTPLTDYTNTVSIWPAELPRRETIMRMKENTADFTEDSKNDSEVTESTNDQLQATSEQLQAASEQLQTTCECLQATTEQLQATSVQLQATSDHLYDSSDKLHAASENLYTTTEKLQYTSGKLCDTSEQLGFDMQMLMNKVSGYTMQYPNTQPWCTNEEPESAVDHKIVENAPHNEEYIKLTDNEAFINNTINSSMKNYKTTVTPCVTPATAAIIARAINNMKSSQTAKTPTQETKTKDTEKKDDAKDEDDKEKELSKKGSSNIEGLAQQATTINPAVPIAEDLPQLKPLPEIDDNVKLSEVMKLVRERNRLVDSHEGTLLMKPKKAVPPLNKPMATPPAYKMPGLPEVKVFPRVCCPRKPRPTTKVVKYNRCNLEALGLDQEGHLIAGSEPQEYPDAINLAPHQSIDIPFIENDFTTDLTEELILQLHFLGNILESSFRHGKAEFLEAAVLAKTRHLAKIFRSQDYEPWSPIPSWPYPKKHKRQKLQCPKDGCKVPPPLSVEDRPCGLKPCESFPTFPKRTFSMLECYPASLSDHKVVDVGNF